MFRSSVIEPVDSDAPLAWTLALGTRELVGPVLDRMNRLVPPERTLAVVASGQATPAALAGRCHHVFCEPAPRNSGMALYVALAMIKRWNPGAIVTITPTDADMAPAGRYLEQVRSARGVAARMRDRVVILGAPPTGPDPELGYLSLGDRLVDVPHVRSVVGFVDKPSPEVASELHARGALWSTMVACGTVGALWELGRATEPHLLDILDSLVPLVGTPDEDDAIDYVYRAYLPVSFPRDVLERGATALCAIALDGVAWTPRAAEPAVALHG